jgi:hypothetical protein
VWLQKSTSNRRARRRTQDAARKTLRVLLYLFARDEAIGLLGAG